MILPKTGSPDVFRMRERELGALPEGHVRIQVRAAGVNWADIQQRLGLYPEAPKRPYVPGYEVAGDVIDAPKISGLRKGTRVVAAVRFGGYASIVDVDARGVAKIPQGLSYEEAAATPVVWLTAHEALHERARVRSGESVLVHGGAGGVGLAAIALATRAGCKVTATAGGRVKCDFVEKCGAQSIDHTAGDWREAANEFGPFDLVLDPLGGEHLQQSVRVLKVGGKVIAYGASATAAKGKFSLPQAIKTIRQMRFSAIGFMRHNTGILGLNMLPAMSDEPERLMKTLQQLMNDMAKGKLDKPVIAATFPLEQVSEAHRFLHNRANIGKVLLTA